MPVQIKKSIWVGILHVRHGTCRIHCWCREGIGTLPRAGQVPNFTDQNITCKTVSMNNLNGKLFSSLGITRTVRMSAL